jgi:hypothetical protein
MLFRRRQKAGKDPAAYELRLWNFSILRCSFEDIEAMISTLLVVSALVISVIVAIMIGIQKDDLKEGDMVWINYLNMTSKPWVLTIDSNGIWHTTVDPFIWDWTYGGFVSHMIANRSIRCVGLLTATILILISTYLSLHISNAREHSESLKRWLIFGSMLIGGSFAMFLYAFFDSSLVIGNAMGILFPAMRQHASYADLEKEVSSGDHRYKNFIVEPKVQSLLGYYSTTGLVIGVGGAILALCVSARDVSSSLVQEKSKKEIMNHLEKAGLNGDESVQEYCSILLRENIDSHQLQRLSAEQLAWMGIPFGDALRISEVELTNVTRSISEADKMVFAVSVDRTE